VATPNKLREQEADTALKEAHAAYYKDAAKNKGQLDPLTAEIKSQRLKEMKDKEEERALAKETAKGPQADAATYAERLGQAEDVFNELSSQGYDRTSTKSALGSMLPGFAQSDEAKRQEQAERSFINAVLRRESGAAISPSEFTSAEKQYFPRAGDSDKVLLQKAENRKAARSGLLIAAGPATGLLQKQKGLLPPTVLPKKQGGIIQEAVASDVPKQGEVVDGYEFIGGNPADKSNWRKAK
jgi:hypothetical protein